MKVFLAGGTGSAGGSKKDKPTKSSIKSPKSNYKRS